MSVYFVRFEIMYLFIENYEKNKIRTNINMFLLRVTQLFNLLFPIIKFHVLIEPAYDLLYTKLKKN